MLFLIFAVAGNLVWVVVRLQDADRIAQQNALRVSPEMLAAAQRGSAAEKMEIADLYTRAGRQADALSLYLAAAKQGAPEAHFRAAQILASDRATAGSLAQAVQHFRVAAETANHSGAQYQLGKMYFEGHGVGQNYAEALKWYERAARNNAPEAQYLMGTMAEDGWGRPKNLVEAYIWYRLAEAHLARGSTLVTTAKTAQERVYARLNSIQKREADQAVAESLRARKPMMPSP